jgi:hypothetical protein
MPHGIPVSRQCPDLTNSLMASSLWPKHAHTESRSLAYIAIGHTPYAMCSSLLGHGSQLLEFPFRETFRAFSERQDANEGADG